MILVFEPTWTGTMHAPGNSATIQTISRAFPDQQIRIYADPTHLHELKRDAGLTSRPQISFHPISLDEQFAQRPHIVSFRRFLRELAAMRAALRSIPNEPCLIMLISATSTAIFAASILSRTQRRRIGIQVGLHGNLNDLNGWRSRNPAIRALDTRSALTSRHPDALRFLVLEQAIRTELDRLAPTAAARTDVLELPVNISEIPDVPETELKLPVRIGFVGQATEAKGISSFLEAAGRLKARHGSAVEFHLVGRAISGSDLTRFNILDSPITDQHLPRASFLERLGALHYVFLPYQPNGYYNLSASGALLDAITWLKPIITTQTPIVADLFARYGDIGYLCDDPEQMVAAVEAIVTAPDPRRYQAQRTALIGARQARTPERLAQQYQSILSKGFTGLLPLPASVPPSKSKAPIQPPPDFTNNTNMNQSGAHAPCCNPIPPNKNKDLFNAVETAPENKAEDQSPAPSPKPDPPPTAP